MGFGILIPNIWFHCLLVYTAHMAVFEFSYSKLYEQRVKDDLADELERKEGAAQIGDNKWLLVGSPEYAHKIHKELSETFRPQPPWMREVYKQDLIDRGWMSKEEFEVYLDAAENHQ